MMGDDIYFYCDKVLAANFFSKIKDKYDLEILNRIVDARYDKYNNLFDFYDYGGLLRDNNENIKRESSNKIYIYLIDKENNNLYELFENDWSYKQFLEYYYKVKGGLLNLSSYATKVSNILTKLDISYQAEKKFKDCIDKNMLPFDFYIKEYNIIIEVDGIQHERVIIHFGGKEAFETIKKHDKIKNEYCKNKFYLIRIHYTEIERAEEIILQIIEKIKGKN